VWFRLCRRPVHALHYAFDVWLTREFPTLDFERYAEDAVVQCAGDWTVTPMVLPAELVVRRR
jgi:hypothetical protein